MMGLVIFPAIHMRRAQPWTTNRARVLRANQTSAEAKLWRALRNRQLCGFKFVRQAKVGPYFADFLCRERMLIVEVDGGTHGEPAEVAADAARAIQLQRMGYHVVRVWNGDVYENLDGALEMLAAALKGEA